MNVSSTTRAALGALATAAMLAGCGAPAMPSASAVQGQNAALADHPDRGPSWMAPDAAGIDLLYISDVTTDAVYVYSYPGGKLKGKLTGFSRPWGLCADTAGTVFVTDLSGSKIFKYRHGAKKPYAILNDRGEEPSDCAVDPTNGNLAVTNVSTLYSSPGDVLIYHQAKGMPKRFKDKAIRYYEFCGYDTAGNLYVDGTTSGNFQLAELPAKKQGFTNIRIDEKLSFAGAVQWDGRNLAVGDYESNLIYQFQISGTTGTKVGVTHLHHASFAVGLWIGGSRVVGPNDESGNVMFWKYPEGGAPVKTIGGLHNPWGATISHAQ